MNSFYNDWYEDFKEAVGAFGDDQLFDSLDSLLKQSRSTFAFNRKLMAKAIDVSWVEAIENGLVHVDNVLRNPGRTIEDVEEIVPIERSRYYYIFLRLRNISFPKVTKLIISRHTSEYSYF